LFKKKSLIDFERAQNFVEALGAISDALDAS